MNSDGVAFICGLFLGAIITIPATLVSLYLLGESPARYKQEAISHGYASYEIVDQKTGKTEFKWK